MAADADDDRVELTELDVITRYSLAVRHATAPRDELIDTLRADLAWLEAGRRRTAVTRRATAAAPAKTTAKTQTRTPAKTPAKKTPTRRSG